VGNRQRHERDADDGLTLDPIRDYFTVSEQEYLALRKRISVLAGGWKLQLILVDGTTISTRYFYFADRGRSEYGRYPLAAPPTRGMFCVPGTGRFAPCIMQHSALLVPQRAVTEQQGSY
jgi:membrane fusion protein (multidrug efflux system)